MNTNKNVTIYHCPENLLDTKNQDLDQYPEFVGKITVTKDDINGTKNAKYCTDTQIIKTIIILDVSGSMGSHVNKIITKYIPDTLYKLGFHPDNDKITLITFSQYSMVHECSGNMLRTFRNGPEGVTYMSPAIAHLKSIITHSTQKQFRILTISDGDLHDQANTLLATTSLADQIKNQYVIRSSAIRLFTSSQQPDTRGLSGMLQLNNIGHTKLVDFHPSIDEEFVNVFTYSLIDDMGVGLKLISDQPIFKSDPWSDSEPKDMIHLFEGENTFWLTKATDITISLCTDSDTSIECQITDSGNLDFTTFDAVLRTKTNHYIERLKILKVVDMIESKKEIEQIIDYFNVLEKNMMSLLPNDTLNNTIDSRLRFLKTKAFRKSKSIIQELSAIANSEKVSALNSAQQADFLRNCTTSSNTINLAKRGIKQGLDFDVKAIQEVIEMKKHLSELDNINDSNHAVSFYSQDTTLSGIKACCELDDENDSLSHMTAIDILSLLNIVGTATDQPVGDYPDPKTYRVSNIMPGVYVSVSDLIVVKQQNHVLKNPYNQDQEITNAIPFYDNDLIQQFLMKYAPNLLEYTASLGMRNMCVNIPSTYKYTIVGGCWLMSNIVQDKPTEINADLFAKFTKTYKTASNGQFDYVIPLLDNHNGSESMYIGNNGITNMIGPMIDLNEPENKDKLHFMPQILRALYTFEFYQIMKKYHRHDSDGHIKRKEMLDKFLGIDFQKYGSKLPELFETQQVPEHYSQYHIDQQMFDDICHRIKWIDYLPRLSDMFGLALTTDSSKNLIQFLESDKSEPELEKYLDLDFSLDKFKIYCIYQGLMADTLGSRYCETTNKMTICNPGNQSLMEKEISEYIKKRYHSHYQSALAEQNKQESVILTKSMVDLMVETDIIEVYETLFKSGMTRNTTHVQISDSWKPGFSDLKEKLFDPMVQCPLRDEKLRILVLGVSKDNQIIYNKGNVLRMSLRDLEQLFSKVNCSDLWESEIRDVYIEKNIHLYRESDLANRHSHNNLKPSYWARGYKNLREYFNDICEEERAEYCQIHTNCCGVWDGKPVKWA